MNSWSQDLVMRAWNFASLAHNSQKVPGSDLPYINHIGNVTMEVMCAIARTREVDDPDLCVQCAILHDIIEDTRITYRQVESEFGLKVADGVLALSKNPDLQSKSERMHDSLQRIGKQPKEVWMVKLADRITNLQPPPHYWTPAKINHYHDEAMKIHDALCSANKVLSSRLLKKIKEYEHYL